jgi:hypothetical protein
MTNTSVNQRIPARRPLAHADEFVRRRGEAEVEKTIVSGGNSTPQINLAWRTRSRRGGQFFRLLKCSGFGLVTRFQLFFSRKVGNGKPIFIRFDKRFLNFDRRIQSHIAADPVGTAWLKNKGNVQGFVTLRIRSRFAEYALEQGRPPRQNGKCCLFYDAVDLIEFKHSGRVTGGTPS